MSAAPRVTVRVTRRFGAPPERVFDAWLNPATAGRWLFATPSGEMVRVQIDPRVGGSYVVTERREGEDIAHTGEYLEIDRPRRLVFTLAVPKYAPHADRVAIDVVPVGGGCELTLAHENVAAEYASRTEAGWMGILDGLAARGL